MVLQSTRWLALGYFTYFFSYGIFLPFWSVWLKGIGLISGNVPQGAGLSSSASLEVAVGTVLQQLYHLPLDGAQIALNGQEAENQFVGCNCGIMDQLISARGKKDHALLIDCRSLGTKAVSMPKGVAVVITRTTPTTSRLSASVSRSCLISPSRTTPRSWRASTALIWTPQAAWPATASTTCWATLPACTRPFWPMPATSWKTPPVPA